MVERVALSLAREENTFTAMTVVHLQSTEVLIKTSAALMSSVHGKGEKEEEEEREESKKEDSALLLPQLPVLLLFCFVLFRLQFIVCAQHVIFYAESVMTIKALG